MFEHVTPIQKVLMLLPSFVTIFTTGFFLFLILMAFLFLKARKVSTNLAHQQLEINKQIHLKMKSTKTDLEKIENILKEVE